MILPLDSARAPRRCRQRHRYSSSRFHRLPQRGPRRRRSDITHWSASAVFAIPLLTLALFGLILMVALEVRKVREASILIGVLTTTALAWGLAFASSTRQARKRSRPPRPRLSSGWAQGMTHWQSAAGNLTDTAFKLDIRGALNKGLSRNRLRLFSSSTSLTTSAPSSPSPSAPASSPPTTQSPASTRSSSLTPPPPSSARSPERRQ